MHLNFEALQVKSLVIIFLTYRSRCLFVFSSDPHLEYIFSTHVTRSQRRLMSEDHHTIGHKRPSALERGPKKRPYATDLLTSTTHTLTTSLPLLSCQTDPLVHYGRHFGRTVHALCNVSALLTNGLLRLGEQAGEPEESFTEEYVSLLASSLSTNPRCPSFYQTEARAPSLRRLVANGAWSRGPSP
jgi:hypothetical protein